MKRLPLLLLPLLIMSCDALTGPQGEKGEPGQDGRDGVANITTRVVDIFGGDVVHALDRDLVMQYRVQELTQDVMESGLVQVYTDVGTNGEGWIALPSNVSPGPDIIHSITYAYLERHVQLYLYVVQCTSPEYDVGCSGESLNMLKDYKLKIVVVPPAS